MSEPGRERQGERNVAPKLDPTREDRHPSTERGRVRLIHVLRRARSNAYGLIATFKRFASFLSEKENASVHRIALASSSLVLRMSMRLTSE